MGRKDARLGCRFHGVESSARISSSIVLIVGLLSAGFQARTNTFDDGPEAGGTR